MLSMKIPNSLENYPTARSKEKYADAVSMLYSFESKCNP